MAAFSLLATLCAILLKSEKIYTIQRKIDTAKVSSRHAAI